MDKYPYSTVSQSTGTVIERNNFEHLIKKRRSSSIKKKDQIKGAFFILYFHVSHFCCCIHQPDYEC
jgi:hypothetical protein